MIDLNFLEFTQAVSYFLSYQDRIGRSFMVDESSLKYPVADLLTSKPFPINSINLEYTHPQYMDRTIDVVITDDTDAIKGAFEFKLAKSTTKYDSEKQRIYNDIARMYAISKIQQCPAFLLIAGKENEFIDNFRNIGSPKRQGNTATIPKAEGFYTEWFEFFARGTKTIDLAMPSSPEYKDFYVEFENTYKQRPKLPALIMPNKIQTRCLGITLVTKSDPTPFVAGLWQIQDINEPAAKGIVI